MTGTELLEKLLRSYQGSYDIDRSCNVDGDIYDAHAKFRVSSAKYVLVKKAELWRANCFEHVFLRVKDHLELADIEKFRKQIVTYIEPELVRGGERWPKKDHMYTYMTVIFICEGAVQGEVASAVKKFGYMKNYMLTIRGYSEARMLVFDLEQRRVLGNRAAKDMVKGYSKAGII